MFFVVLWYAINDNLLFTTMSKEYIDGQSLDEFLRDPNHLVFYPWEKTRGSPKNLNDNKESTRGGVREIIEGDYQRIDPEFQLLRIYNKFVTELCSIWHSGAFSAYLTDLRKTGSCTINNINTLRNKAGNTFLMLLYQNGYEKYARELESIEWIRINPIDRIVAKFTKYSDTDEQLLAMMQFVRSSWDINAIYSPKKGETLLMYLCKKYALRNTKQIQVLIEFIEDLAGMDGIDLNIPDSSGYTPMDILTNINDEYLRPFLSERGGKLSRGYIAPNSLQSYTQSGENNIGSFYVIG